MKVVISRKRKLIWVKEGPVQQVCKVGFYFAFNHPHLTEAGWRVAAPKEDNRGWFGTGLEHYEIDQAYALAEIIKNPPILVVRPAPLPPVHDCPGCKCPPECC